MRAEKSRVMFVDDDPMLLSSTRRQLINKLPDCELVFCQSGAHALDEIGVAVPDVIFSDIRMPEMDGPEFLRRVAHSHPETVRIGWTGQPESNQLHRILQVSHQVLRKPCATENLRQIILDITRFQRQLADCWLLPRLTHPNQSHADPEHLASMLSMLDSPDVSATVLAETVEQSAITRARLLGIANSSLFSPDITISDTVGAIQMVGFGMIRAILDGADLHAEKLETPEVALELKECLEQGNELAQKVHRYAERNAMSVDDRNSALIAAMFYRFGRIQFAIHGGEEYSAIKREAAGSNTRLESLELDRFGSHHGSVAAYMLCVWGMDSLGCKAIASQHESSPTECPVERALRDCLGEHQAEVHAREARC